MYITTMGPVDIGGSCVDIDEWFGSTVAVGLEASRCPPLIALYIYTTYEQLGSQVGKVCYRVPCIEEKNTGQRFTHGSTQ